MKKTAVETPDWLKEEVEHDNSSQPSPPAPSEQKVKEPVVGPTLTESSSDDKSKEVPRMIFLTRMINLILSVSIIIACILSLLTTTSATTGVLACYVVVFSCLLCCYETHLKQVSKLIATNFGFLYSGKSRAIYMLFIATIMMFNFSVFGQLMGLLMLGNAGFNVFVLCMYPGFEEAQRTDAQADIQDFLKSNPAYAQQALSYGVAAGSQIMAENPDLAKQGAAAGAAAWLKASIGQSTSPVTSPEPGYSAL